MKYYYLVAIEVPEKDWTDTFGHTASTAGAVFHDEIQSNLESCPEIWSAKVVQLSTRAMAETELAAVVTSVEPNEVDPRD
jgi:hypothetical protein